MHQNERYWQQTDLKDDNEGLPYTHKKKSIVTNHFHENASTNVLRIKK